jgi:hypothetical protein
VLRQTPDGEIFVEGVSSRRCSSSADLLSLLAEGASRRAVGETNMNAASSRSHAVLTLRLSLTYGSSGGSGKGLTRSSKLHLIDLAGSERADSTGAAGERLKEGAQINKSLSALGNVITALTTSGRSHVPYRDSKLTRLLQDSLGGNCVTVMLCCVSPAASSYDETLASLRFAQRAKLVKNVARINVDPAAARMAALEGQLRSLQARSTLLEAALARKLGLHWPLPAGASAAATQAARAALEAELLRTRDALRSGASVSPEPKALSSAAPAALPASSSSSAPAPAAGPGPAAAAAPASKPAAKAGCAIM